MNKVENDKLVNHYLLNTEKPKLQIGCGNNILESWLNSDLVGSVDLKIVVLDASKIFPFRDATFSHIYSEHVFEHLTFEKVNNMVSEIYRTLKPNGHLRVATPDLNFLMKLYQNQNLPIHRDYLKWSFHRYCKEPSEILKGDENAAVYVNSNFYRAWGHQIIHNFDSIKEILEMHGFLDVIPGKVGVSDIDEFNNIEKHSDIISSKFNELESMIIEARKGN